MATTDEGTRAMRDQTIDPAEPVPDPRTFTAAVRAEDLTIITFADATVTAAAGEPVVPDPEAE